MIDSKDLLKKEAQVRARRRRNAGWKSGLILTGLGAVVAGAGYLAGVNAPAAGQSVASQSVAPTGAVGTGSEQLLAPNNNRLNSNGFSSDEGQGLELNDDAPSRPESSGTSPLIGGDGSSSQLNQQFSGRRSRQFRGSSQQQPNFSSPVTRSRGS